MTRRLAVCLALAALACSPPPPESDGGSDTSSGDATGDVGSGPVALSVVPTGAMVTMGVVADDGATIELVSPSHTYTLLITPSALAADTEITLEEVTVPELPGAVALRMAPDGLVFEVPALLTVNEAHDEPVLGLAFRAGEPGVEMVFAAPLGDGTALAIEHFSEAALVPSAEADPALDEEQRMARAEVTTQETATALALGTLLRGRIARLIERADLRFVELRAASRALQDARASMQRGAVEGLNASASGPPTVLALTEEMAAAFEAKALELYANLTAPRCIPGRDVVELADWADVVHDLLAELALLTLPVPPEPSLCVTTRIDVVASEAPLTSADDEVVIDRASLTLVGPGETPETAALSAPTFTFAATGATGPTSRTATGDAVTDIVFVRPDAPRPPFVRISISAVSEDVRVLRFPAPAPVTVQRSEATIHAGTIGVDATCTGPIGSVTTSCTSGSMGCGEVYDQERISISASLRIRDAYGASPTIEASDVFASRVTEHSVCERYRPLDRFGLLAYENATLTPRADGSFLLSLCGRSEHNHRMDAICTSDTEATTTEVSACYEMILRPSPSADDPRTLLPELLPALRCASANEDGALALE